MLDKRKVLAHALDWYIQELGAGFAAGRTHRGQRGTERAAVPSIRLA